MSYLISVKHVVQNFHVLKLKNQAIFFKKLDFFLNAKLKHNWNLIYLKLTN